MDADLTLPRDYLTLGHLRTEKLPCDDADLVVSDQIDPTEDDDIKDHEGNQSIDDEYGVDP